MHRETPPVGRGKHSVRLYADRIIAGCLPHTPKVRAFSAENTGDSATLRHDAPHGWEPVSPPPVCPPPASGEVKGENTIGVDFNEKRTV